MGYPGIVDGLQSLILRAYDNDSEAAQTAHGFLVYLIQNFNEVCKKNPKVFEPIARKFLDWPGFISRIRDAKNDNEKIMDSLCLGKDVGLNFSKGKQPSIKTQEIKIAMRLHGLVDMYRKSWTPEEIAFRKRAVALTKKKIATLNKTIQPPKHDPVYDDPANKAGFVLQSQSRDRSKNLQPLNRDNYKDWFNAAWPAFLSHYGKDFEKRGAFKNYKQGTPGQKRDAIKKKLRQAFRSLAPQIG